MPHSWFTPSVQGTYNFEVLTFGACQSQQNTIKVKIIDVTGDNTNCSLDLVVINDSVKSTFASSADAVLKTITVGGSEDTLTWDVAEWSSVSYNNAGSSCSNVEWLVSDANDVDA